MSKVETNYHAIGESMICDCEIVAVLSDIHFNPDTDKRIRTVYELARVTLSCRSDDSQDWDEFVTECLGVWTVMRNAYRMHPEGGVKVTLTFNDHGLDGL